MSGADVLQRVRYAAWMPWLFWACAALNALVAIGSHQPLQALLSVLTGGIGVAYFLNPMFELTATELRLKNAWGMTVRTVGFRSLADLEIQDRVLWLRTTAGQRTKVNARLVHAGDWAALGQRLADAHPTESSS